MAYSSIVKPTDYFNTILWTGDNTARTISGVGFQPDWIWWKQRNGTDSHRLADSVRGEGSASYKLIFSEDTSAEYDGNDNGGSQGNINAITSDGFSGVQGSSGYNNWNGSSYNYVAWNWKAGTSGSGSTGGSGTSKSYTYSVNTTAGFSITRYTGNGTSGHTIPHNLGVTPQMIIIKSTELTQNWIIYHHKLNSGTNPEVKYLELNSTNAQLDSASTFNDAPPTSSHFVLGNSDAVNTSNGVNIAYCFAEKKGYSKFGSYTGNGNADGTFVYTGFRPAWVIVKVSSGTTGNWQMQDTKRLGYNDKNVRILANVNEAEKTDQMWDILSNGFKVRSTSGNANGSGNSYIYMAFAEHPFVANDSGTAVPVVAR